MQGRISCHYCGEEILAYWQLFDHVSCRPPETIPIVAPTPPAPDAHYKPRWRHKWRPNMSQR
jgi:hypothetical protein